MGSQNLVIWDEEIADCFSLWGGRKIAIYFEALRYRQQLFKQDEYFPYSATSLEKNIGLTYKQQLHAKKVLEGSGWLETRRKQNTKKGSALFYRVTELAREATSHIKRPRDITELKREAVKNIGRFHNKRG